MWKVMIVKLLIKIPEMHDDGEAALNVKSEI